MEVIVGGRTVDDVLLGPEGIEVADHGMLGALANADGELGRLNPAKLKWRLLDDANPDVVLVAAPTGESWIVVELHRAGSGWAVETYSWDQRVRPTAATLGAGLRLEWTQPEFVIAVGGRLDLSVRLFNDTDEVRSWDGGNFDVWGNVLHAANLEPVWPGPHPVTIAGVGVSWRVKPGRSIDERVFFPAADDRGLPEGEYVTRASWPDLALTTPDGRLVVSRRAR